MMLMIVSVSASKKKEEKAEEEEGDEEKAGEEDAEEEKADEEKADEDKDGEEKAGEDKDSDEKAGEDKDDDEKADDKKSKEKKGDKDGKKGDKKDEKKAGDSESKPKKPKLACNKDLVGTLGMTGLAEPKALELEMCPTVTNSCCEVKDQLIMYDNWTTNEKPKLEEQLKAHKDIYLTLLLELVEVATQAKSLYTKLEKEPDSNCKVIASRLVDLNIKEQHEKIKAQLEGFHEFILTLHRGFYCSLCDANAQKFIDITKMELVVSKSTCRDIVAKSFVFLIYFHVHLVKVLNLSALYANSCDADGVFSEKAIPQEHNFTVDGSIEQLLFDVRDYRNKSNWFNYFKNYCEKTSVTQFTEFLMPNVKKIETFTKYIRGVNKAGKGSAETTELVEKVAKDSGSGTTAKALARLLKDMKKEEGEKKTEEKKEEEKEIEKDEKEIKTMSEDKEKIEKKVKHSIYESFEIYNVNLNAVIPINELKTTFKDPGINLYEVGVCTLFEQALYDKIKSMKGDKGKSKDTEKKDKGKDKDKAKAKAAGKKDKKSANIWRAALALFAILVIII